MTGRRVHAATALVLGALLLAGCAGPDPGAAGTAGSVTDASGAPTQTPSPSPSPSAEIVTPEPTDAPSSPPPADPLTAQDIGVLDAFVGFATAQDPASAGAVPLADAVAIGLGPTLRADLAGERRYDAAAWALDADLFRARSGTISSLQVIADHLALSAEPPEALRYGVGAHEHCAGPPMPDPDAVSGLRHLWIQPTPAATTCLDWFTVDLYVDGDHVRAVTVDVWEP